MSEQLQEEYGDNGIRLSAAELFKRWKRAVEHGEDNFKIGLKWMEEATRLAKRNALLVKEIETLREERDELRRRLCSYEGAWRRVNNPLDEAHLHDRPDEIAKEWGWDCFKEKA